ncbi:hypothetical protein C8R46DRAFT_365689 [Mycena filopes]|nr:hypothetical protein C8R46DRAFT_365689 [Mycena filopes]
MTSTPRTTSIHPRGNANSTERATRPGMSDDDALLDDSISSGEECRCDAPRRAHPGRRLSIRVARSTEGANSQAAWVQVRPSVVINEVVVPGGKTRPGGTAWWRTSGGRAGPEYHGHEDPGPSAGCLELELGHGCGCGERVACVYVLSDAKPAAFYLDGASRTPKLPTETHIVRRLRTLPDSPGQQFEEETTPWWRVRRGGG